MPELLRMPSVAADATTATLADWLVAENHPYSSDEPIATIETDKAVVDLTAEADGVLLRILASAGTEVRVGEPIAVIGKPGEPAGDIDGAVASLLGGASLLAAGETAGLAPAPVPEEMSGAEAPPGTTPQTNGVRSKERIFASPLARRLAKHAGIPTESITGSGPHGRIVRKDVELAISIARTGPPTPSTPATPAAAPVVAAPVLAAPVLAAPAAPAALAGVRTAATADGAATSDVPHSRMRRAIAQRLTDSTRLVPHFSLRGSARVDELLALRTQLNEAAAVKISVNDLLLKAVARAHHVVPAMNVIWTDDAVRVYSTVDLGVAIATDTGLVTPVLRAVDQMSIGTVTATASDFADRARQGRIRQHELEGGSCTITNLGMYGTDEFTAIINPPQSSILAVGAARREPVVTDTGTVDACSVLRLTLSVDHRAIDGAVAAQWMQAMIETLEAPLRILV